MTYKTGFKGYFLLGVCYGVPMGVVFGLMFMSAVLGLVTGVLAGVLFGGGMFLASKIAERKFDKKRAEIAAQRRIICDGAATIQGNGGWMFLTDFGIELYPHKLNFSTKELMLPLAMIAGVRTKGNKIVIATWDRIEFHIVVAKNKEWKAQIENAVRAFAAQRQ